MKYTQVLISDMKHEIIPFYPKCDNCGKPIKGDWKYTKISGIIVLVHKSYDENFGKCKN